MMAPNQLHALSRALGGLEEAVKGLKKGQDDERNEAKQHRDSLRNVIDALTEAMRALTGEVDNLKRDIKDVGKDVVEMQPSIEDYERNRSEALGRAKFGRWLVAVWMTISGAVVALLTWALSHWKGLGIVLLALGLATVALARDLGQWSQSDPSIRQWMKGLRDKSGMSCCDEADGHEVEGWSFQRPDVPAYYHPSHQGYWVKVKGQWLIVPPKALLEIPNRLGYARVWLVYESGQPIVRCFIAGAGG